jgi:(2Fe-2S) ferredoxin
VTVVELTSVDKGVAPPSGPGLSGSGPVGDRRVGLVVCRGCCCGNAERDPGTDHSGQLTRLERFAHGVPARLLVRTTECLGPCEQANVVVVRPSAAGRRLGGRPVWLGLVNDDDAVGLLERWVDAGGPGRAELPAALGLHVIARPMRRGGERVR